MTIRPDLVLRLRGLNVAVADTKYKVLDDKGKLRNEDGYQLLAYCSRLGLPVGHLIYAAGTLPKEPYQLIGAGVRLEMHKIELARPLAAIAAAVARLRTRMLSP